MTKPVFSGFTFDGTSIPDGVVTGTIGQFIFVSLLSDQFSVQWCAIGDPTDWPIPATSDASAKQAGKETLNPDHGFVTGITGNEFFGYVFQQRGITKFTYVGGDIVFSVDTFEETRGCINYNRWERVDDVIFFESEFGRHKLVNNQVTDIGYGKTDDTYTPTDSDEQQDVVKNIAIHTVFFEDHNLAYNYKTDQWTRIPAFDGQGYFSIESADGVIGQIVFSGTNFDYQTSTGGVSNEATLEVSESNFNEGGRAIVDGVRPLVNGGTVAVRVGVRNDLDDSVTYSTGTSINSRTGMSNFRGATNSAEGRYHRTELKITGGFTTALGADIEFYPAGRV